MRVDEEVLLARALLSRITEPASIPLWAAVRDHGAVDVARAIRAGTAPPDVTAAVAARAGSADPAADLEAAERHGIRLVVPESAEWPHFAFSALEAAGIRRLARYRKGERERAEGGDPIPPLALWVRGGADLAALGVRSVAIVGARAATDYGIGVTRDLASRLAGRGFSVVSGGAFGIDAAAHRAALAAGGETVLVSAGGLDRPYPTAHARLYDQVAESGLLVSESPPGCAPHRHRFLTRNRLIAGLGTGTVVVEAARRSGALNTAQHCRELERPLLAVPGPITSSMSVGCHRLLAAERDRALLVTEVNDVLEYLGCGRDLLTETDPDRRAAATLRERLDELDDNARRVFDGFPSRGSTDPDRLAVVTGLPAVAVLRALPVLELVGLVETSTEGYRIASAVRRSRPSTPGERNGSAA